MSSSYSHVAPNRTALALRNIAVLLQNIPQRLHTLRIRCESKSRKLPFVYEERHRQIFPSGFDSTSSSSSPQRSYYAFDPEQLYDVLTSGYNPKHHVEHIIVKSASYCKQKTGPKHEFIILEVEDKKSPGLKNWIALDRNNGEPPRTTTFYSSSQSFVAKDEFRVSNDGNKAKLLAQCGLKDHEILETLDFKPDEPLLLYQLAALTRTVSLQRDIYNFLTANCYWFAGLIWDCMIRMRPSACRKILQGQIRGAFLSWLHLNANVAELEVTYEQVDKEILDIDNKFAAQKQRWTHEHDKELNNEVEALKKQLRELQELLDATSDPCLH